MAHILLVEDAVDLHQVIQESLQPEHQVNCVTSLAEARDKVAGQDWDMLIVDVGLTDGNGFELANEIKAHKNLPFMFLTGRSEVDDKLKAFALGAQDYVTKPFDARELRARVNARLKCISNASQTFQNNTFRIEVPLQRAYVSEAGGEKALNLTPIEFKLLYYFCSNEDRIVNRDELLNVVWGKTVNVLERTIDKHISALRQKLGEHARQIETIPQVGYRYRST